MLRDACSLTSVAPKRSRHRRGGLIYTQLYSSVKEISDASKQFPFANDGLEELVLDQSFIGGNREVRDRTIQAGPHKDVNKEEDFFNRTTRYYKFVEDKDIPALLRLVSKPDFMQDPNAARHTVGGRQPSLEIIKKAYIASKKRAMAALVASVRKSFGIREEHRVSVDLFEPMCALCDDYEDDGDDAIPLDDCPPHAWAVDTNFFS